MQIIQQLKKYKLNKSVSIGVISLLYLLVSTFLYSKYEIQIVIDSARYLEYAENISNGFYFDPLNFWSISYVFFVYINRFISDSLGFLVFNQYLFGYIGLLALFAGTRKLTGSLKAATLAAIIFILFPDNLMWSSYILTESFYLTSICICFYFLMEVYKNPNRKWVYFMLIPVMLMCFFSKPTSPALFLAILAPSLFFFLKDKSRRVWKVAGTIVVGITLLFLANKMIGSHHVILMYEKGDIIFAMHEFPSHPYHDLLTIDVPEDLYVPSSEGPLLVNMANFMAKNPLFFTKLMIGKIILYVTHIRPYWSWSHNVMVVLFLWTSYFFTYLSIRKKLISSDLIFSFLVYFVVHTLIVATTWVDWDGRFFTPLIPFIAILGTMGMISFFEESTRVELEF